MYLDSPRFGERWGRHWLDVVRLCRIQRQGDQRPLPHAWRYRDYVIESFNEDKPYDQFIKEQIAGDLMKYQDKRQQGEQIVATGFLAIGAKATTSATVASSPWTWSMNKSTPCRRHASGSPSPVHRCHDHELNPLRSATITRSRASSSAPTRFTARSSSCKTIIPAS